MCYGPVHHDQGSLSIYLVLAWMLTRIAEPGYQRCKEEITAIHTGMPGDGGK
jgi:hypothetical protein